MKFIMDYFAKKVEEKEAMRIAVLEAKNHHKEAVGYNTIWDFSQYDRIVITCPDLPGYRSEIERDNRSPSFKPDPEAYLKAKAEMAEYICHLQQNGEEIPKPSRTIPEREKYQIVVLY